ncbi:MAG: RES family NAD+ phosphorylase [Cryomorphaceae bacterium]|nr:RES family NAD+ phosphorylase [Flavobacteriales bacterium]
MRLFRLTREKYAHELSGIGAARFGYRWNSAGVEMIYTAESRALALAEVLPRLTAETLPNDFCMVEITVPDEVKVHTLSQKSLPADWSMFPHPESTKAFGDSFVKEGKYCLMRVPSAVVEGDFNCLINPHHGQFAKIKVDAVRRFKVDHRLVR